MEREELLRITAEVSGADRQTAEKIVSVFLDRITEELSKGGAVDLGEDFGKFSVKLRTNHLAENSPRTPKDSRYKVVFRENKGMKKRLKVDE